MGRFTDLSFRSKLLLLFVISAFYAGAIAVTGIANMLRMRDASRQVYAESFTETRRLLELDRDLERTRRLLLTMLLDPRHMSAEAVERLMESHRKIEINLEQISQVVRFSEEVTGRKEVLRLKAIWSEFLRTRDEEVLPALRDGRVSQALKVVSTVQERRFSEAVALIDALVEHENMEAIKAQGYVDRIFRSTALTYFIIAAAGFACCGALSVYFSRNTLRRLKGLTDGFKRVKRGDLDFKIEAEGRDELGEMSEDFNRMARQLYEDRVMQEQSIQIFNWYADESSRKVKELESVNSELACARAELESKNTRLEESIHEVNEINRTLEVTRAQMFQAEKMASLGQLSAGIAHEINNPVGFIRSNLNSMSEYLDDLRSLSSIEDSMLAAFRANDMEKAAMKAAELEGAAKSINHGYVLEDMGALISESRDGINRVASIVKGLKDFSHVGETDKAETDLNACIDKTVKLCWHEIKYKAVLEKEYGDLPLVPCQEQRISQVVMNILVNAAQAIEEKGRIIVKTSLEDGSAVIRISDDGAGMPEDVSKRIFEPFFTTKPVGQGTGLGLSIAYGIITEHGGSIEVESAPGTGTTFKIKLPVCIPEAG